MSADAKSPAVTEEVVAKKTTFAEELGIRLRDMEARAKAVGSNMTQVTKATGIARATFERWEARPPQSITKVDELEAEVARLEEEFRKSQAAAT
jgi:hypothetical protein